jgi:glucose/mannose transport system substrate-binding protein
MFSWWTAGGEADGLNAMYDIYKKTYPNVDVVNATVAGGAGTNAKAVLATRLTGGDPPDSFQLHAGLEVESYAPDKYLQTLDALYASAGLDKAFPKDLLTLLKYQDHYWGVPVNIHRANVLWYNKKVFADNNLQPPKTWDEFFKTADTLKAKNIVPLVIGTKEGWEAGHTFETILIASLGADGYRGLWTGKTQWTDPKVTEALNTFSKMMTYANTDHSALTWDAAAQYLVDGKGAMHIMGDWTDGWFTSKKFTGYGWAPVPGTTGVFDALSDSFAAAKGAKNQENLTNWLKLAGSKAGQEAFNPKKGSICARTDCDPKLFNEYLQSAMKDWSSNAIVPSVAHGAAAVEKWATVYKDILNSFATKRDVATAQKSLQQTCVDQKTCKELSGKLEMFSWWTAGGEADGLNAMYALYKAANPKVEIINATVAGGAGTNAKAVLATRLTGGDHPDSFQLHAGLEVESYAPDKYLQTLDALYASEGLDKAFPKDLLTLLKYQDHYWGVPVNIHRANVLWYNKKIFADNNLRPPETWGEFFRVADTLQAKKIVPLVIGTKEGWEAGHTFETILIASLGADGYRGLWTGKTQWTDAKVTDALNTFKKMMTYANTDYSALTWDAAAQYLVDGKGAMHIMGDWTDGWFTSKKFTGYGWAPVPGTTGVFDALSDSFAAPKGAKNKDNLNAWLALAGSKAGQEAFNPKKGSICARTDCDPKLFNEYLQSAMKDWSSNAIVPSVAHGAAAVEKWATVYKDILNSFATKGDVATAQKSLQQVCVDNKVCK